MITISRSFKAITMIDLAVLLEERDLVDRGLDTHYDDELVVHLDADRSHLVFDTTFQPAHIESIAHLSFVVAMQFSSQNSGCPSHAQDRCVDGFDRLNKGFQ